MRVRAEVLRTEEEDAVEGEVFLRVQLREKVIDDSFFKT